MPAAPSAEELGPLLGESNSLDEELPDPYADENGEFMAAARMAVGTDAKATALKDAIVACMREHGLLSEPEAAEEDAEVGEGFPDL